MSNVVGIGMPGPFELTILGAIVAVPVAVVVLVVWLVRRSGK
jgi:hypothetical protein